MESTTRYLLLCGLLLAAFALVTACGQKNDTEANLTLTRLVAIDAAGSTSASLEVDLCGNGANSPVQGVATLGNDSSLGDTTHAGPSITLTKYHVIYSGGLPGVDVPYPIEGSLEGLIPPKSFIEIKTILLRHESINEPPLSELGGHDLTGGITLQVYGLDSSGRELVATGTLPMHLFCRSQK